MDTTHADMYTHKYKYFQTYEISYPSKLKYTPLSLVSYVVTSQKNITLGRWIAGIEWVVIKVLMSTKLYIGSQNPFSFGIT